MAIAQGQTTSFKVGLLCATFNFNTGTTQVYKLALYSAAADLGAATTAYSATNEITGTGYSAGGATLTVSQIPTSSGTVAYISFSDVSWSMAATARGGLIYLANGTTNPSVAVLDFGADKTSTTTFTVTIPSPSSTTAIVRIK